MSSKEEKINFLMEKISVLENSLFEEREKRMKFEDELKILNADGFFQFLRYRE